MPYNVLNEYVIINNKRRKVGTITWFLSNDECCISTISVLPAYRGNGIAGKLLASVLSKYPQCRFKAIILGGKENIAAYKLFLRAGFSFATISEPSYHNQDVLLMIK